MKIKKRETELEKICEKYGDILSNIPPTEIVNI